MKTEEHRFVDLMMYALTAPTIVWPQDVPDKEMLERAKLERLAAVAQSKGQPLPMCTDFEAVIYLSGWSLEHPPSEHWFRLYMYVFKKCFPGKADFLDGAPEPQEYEMHDLVRLKEWIFKKQMEHIKEKQKQAKAHAKEAQPQSQQQTVTVVKQKYADLAAFCR
jgi:hypothetical protein